MKRQEFEDKHAENWRRFEESLEVLEARKKAPEVEFPALFRQICSDLSLAQYRMYGLRLSDRLNTMVIRGHKQLYRGVSNLWERILRFFVSDFPRAVRADAKLFWLSNAFFWLPALLLVLGAQFDTRWSHSVLGPEVMANLEAMYGEGGDPIAHLREEFGSDFRMFCFYIFNNVSIDFRIFAGGILAGIGSLFFVAFNGIFLGAAVAYIHEAADTERFYGFVSGHAPFELLGMFVAGMAGLRIGFAIIRPGRHSRKQALIHASKRAILFLYGAAALTFLAAIVEAFWSGTRQAPAVKYGASALITLTLILYLGLAGRREEPA